jgi:hypothetical protein
MQINVAFTITREHSHDIVNSTDAKQNQMLAGETEKRAHNSFRIKSEFGLSLPRGQPRSPYPNEREPSWKY